MFTRENYFFKLKFWPDRENKKMPTDDFMLDDEYDMFEMLRYRNQVRLYFLNWRDVWDTYSYVTTYHVPLIILLVLVLTQSWITVSTLVLILFAVKRFIIGRNKRTLRAIAILVPGLFDEQLREYFGPLLPFSGDCI